MIIADAPLARWIMTEHDNTNADERDLSGHHLSVGKIAAVIGAICGAVLAVVVPVVWWASGLTTEMRLMNSTLTAMQKDVAAAARLGDDIEAEGARINELKTRVDVLYSRVDHLWIAEEARKQAAAAGSNTRRE